MHGRLPRLWQCSSIESMTNRSSGRTSKSQAGASLSNPDDPAAQGSLKGVGYIHPLYSLLMH